MRQNTDAKPMHLHAFDAAEALTRAQLRGFREALRNFKGEPMHLRAMEMASAMTDTSMNNDRPLPRQVP